MSATNLLLRTIDHLPARVRSQLMLAVFGLSSIRLLLFVTPTVEEMTDDRCVLRIPLNWRTRNHLGSMYFGALATGADITGAIAAFEEMARTGNRVVGVFKDFHADFIRRPMGDVRFVCEQVREVRELVQRALHSGEREEFTMNITAETTEDGHSVTAAQFALTLSVKRKR